MRINYSGLMSRYKKYRLTDICSSLVSKSIEGKHMGRSPEEILSIEW